MHQDAVLPGERHHVGHGRERHQIEQVQREIGREPERGHQRLHQLEGEPGAAELREAGASSERCGSTTASAGGKLGAGQVVVGHHHLDPLRSAPAAPRPTAVMPQSQVMISSRADLARLGEPGVAEVVAVAQAVRHEGGDLRARPTRARG